MRFWCYSYYLSILDVTRAHVNKRTSTQRLLQLAETECFKGPYCSLFPLVWAPYIMSCKMINCSVNKQLHLSVVYPQNKNRGTLSTSPTWENVRRCAHLFSFLQDVHPCCHGVLVCGLEKRAKEMSEEWKHYVSDKILRHTSLFMQCGHGWTTTSSPPPSSGASRRKILGQYGRGCSKGWRSQR